MTITRRALLSGGAAAATVAVATRAFAQFQPSGRYPDPAIQIVDPSFTRYRLGAAKVQQLAPRFRRPDGPGGVRDRRDVRWSDIPNNPIERSVEAAVRG